MADSHNGRDWREGPVAVLVSGGLDSAVLLADLAAAAPRVVPIYVRFGMFWEEAEERVLRQFLSSLPMPALDELRVFSMNLRDVYGDHWSTTGEQTPDERTADDAVYLPGRNVLLLAQAAVWCRLNGIPTIALAPLAQNPFPDATDDFFADFARIVNRAVDGSIQIVCPYRTLKKADVLLLGREMPLDKTFSCIRPISGVHCGRCNKCAERKAAFAQAAIDDVTVYHDGRLGSNHPGTVNA